MTDAAKIARGLTMAQRNGLQELGDGRSCWRCKRNQTWAEYWAENPKPVETGLCRIPRTNLA